MRTYMYPDKNACICILHFFCVLKLIPIFRMSKV